MVKRNQRSKIRIYGNTLNPSDHNHHNFLLMDQQSESVLVPPQPGSSRVRAISPTSTLYNPAEEETAVIKKDFNTTKSLASTKGTLSQSAAKKSFVPTHTTMQTNILSSEALSPFSPSNSTLTRNKSMFSQRNSRAVCKSSRANYN